MRPAHFVPDSKPVDALLRGDAGRAPAHRGRRRRVRRHRRPDHDRGPARGDRRRDHRRVRRGRGRGRAPRRRRGAGLLALPDRRPRRAVRLRRRGGGRRQRRRADGQAPRPGADPRLGRRGPRPALRGRGGRRPAQQDRHRADPPGRPPEPSRARRHASTDTTLLGDRMALSAEDRKLVTLARATRARTGAAEGAAVRDPDGRTYAAATVDLPSLRLSRAPGVRRDGGRVRVARAWRPRCVLGEADASWPTPTWPCCATSPAPASSYTSATRGGTVARHDRPPGERDRRRRGR